MSRLKPSLNAPFVPQVLAPPAARQEVRVPAAPKAEAPPATVNKGTAIDADNVVRRLAFFAALGFIFVRFTFLHEVIALTLGIRSFLPPLFGIPAVLGLVFSGSLRRIFQRKVMFWWFAFAGWLLLTVLTSAWPGGSAELVTRYFQTDFPLLLLIAGLTRTWRDLRWVFYSIAMAGMVNELTARYLSREVGGRLELTGIVTIGNANDFAAHMLLILPIFIFLLMSTEVPKILRFLAVAAIPACLYFTLRTGSRGAIIALALTYVFVLITAKGMQRLAFAVAVPVITVLLLLTIPGVVIERFSTIFHSDVNDEEASRSSDGRKYLLKRGVELTLNHPLWGNGPGQFANTEGASRAGGMTGQWMAPHNSYTQVSSEMGIPGLIFLLGALISSYQILRRVRSVAQARGNRPLERAAFALMMSFVLFCVSAFFLSLAYRFYFPTLGGLALGLYTVAENEFSLNTQRT